MSEEVRNLRDFLMVYNSLTENCFNHCIVEFNHRQLITPENVCLFRCIDKHLRANRRTLQVFTEFGPSFMARKQEQQEQQEQQSLPS